MPHLILECSNSIASAIDFKSLFQKLHRFLEVKLPTQITSCKSRVAIYDHCFIGCDFDKTSFIHLTIKILPGRPDTIKFEVTKQILDILIQVISEYKLNDTAISVDILDLSPQYIKS
ncbi:MAG: hypothetical protein H0T84_00690 [Tatlockia sp.]|nr:hypothetical protein [Tatlockia sp.]